MVLTSIRDFVKPWQHTKRLDAKSAAQRRKRHICRGDLTMAHKQDSAGSAWYFDELKDTQVMISVLPCGNLMPCASQGKMTGS